MAQSVRARNCQGDRDKRSVTPSLSVRDVSLGESSVLPAPHSRSLDTSCVRFLHRNPLSTRGADRVKWGGLTIIGTNLNPPNPTRLKGQINDS